jgi:5-methylcytosine-specific restriction endonuclease McrA
MASSVERKAIFQRDRFSCVYCSREFPEAELTLDHVQPRVKGGDHSAGNLVTACKECNALKGGQAAWFFLARDNERRANFLKNAKEVWPRHIKAINEEAEKRS